jgi:hypothetical protein
MSFSVFSKEVVVNPENYNWISDSEYQFQKSKAKERSSRVIASQNEVTDDLMSKEYKSFRDKFLTIKTPEELDRYLVEIDQKYDTYPNDLKFVVAMIAPMQVMRSFTYKAYPLATQEKLTHSLIVTQILNFASFMKINLPTEQWMAGFRYVTEPYRKTDDEQKIQNVNDLQIFTAEKLYPALLKCATRISKIQINDKFIWDNKLLYGTGSFSDNFKRYRTFGEAERFAILSSIHSNLSAIARFQAYNLDELVPLMKDVASLYGYDSAFLSEVDGVNAKKISSILNKSKYKSLFTLKTNGAKNMATAYKHLKESTRFALVSWSETRDRSYRESDLFGSDIVASVSTRIDNNAEMLEKIVYGQTTIRSDVTGEVITVNYPSLYLSPIKDLKMLAPVKFEAGEKTLVKRIDGNSMKYRNYFYGRSIGWNVDAYRNLFPEIKNGEVVSQYTKILNQSTGSDLLGMVLNSAIIY